MFFVDEDNEIIATGSFLVRENLCNRGDWQVDKTSVLTQYSTTRIDNEDYFDVDVAGLVVAWVLRSVSYHTLHN